MALLELRGVTRRFEGEGAPPLEVLRGIDLELERGETLSIVGASGCGKSTLLNLIGGLDEPTAGQVVLYGEELAALGADRLAAVRAEKLGFVFQSHHLLPQCSALENVLVPTLVAGAERRAEGPERARALLARVGLAERFAHRPAQLSGGERQRVALVRALINRPVLVLADEPTGALDGETARELAALLVEQCAAEDAALIVVTHDLGLAAQMGRGLTLEGGRLVAAAAAR
jgi:lipoprotein-releasing system ATP-binding protein